MKIAVVYAGQNPLALNCTVDDGTTVRQAIEASGILHRCPDIDLAKQKVGVFGKFVNLTGPLHEGDRVEIYRKITRVLDDENDDDDD